MSKEVFDTAIIGGGLAGLTLAIQLADAGKRVILFEKGKYPFHKVCGEYISMESHAFLERLGIPLSTMDLPLINELKVSAPNGNALIRKLGQGGFGISRYTLDSSLATLAKSKGVLLLEETKVTQVTFENNLFTITANGITCNALVACGTYGKRSALDTKLQRKFRNGNQGKRKNYVGVKYHVQLELPANRIELHNFRDGYCGISKVEGNKYCLCYLTDAKNLNQNNNDIRRMEQEVLMQNPYLKKYLSEAVYLYNEPLTISQITFDKKTAVEQHLLMLGDSAGTISPLCGNGMSMAMHASYLASSLICDFLNGNSSRTELENRYENQWMQLFDKRIKIGKGIQYLFGKERLSNLSIGILKQVPVLCDKLIGMTHGRPF